MKRSHCRGLLVALLLLGAACGGGDATPGTPELAEGSPSPATVCPTSVPSRTPIGTATSLPTATTPPLSTSSPRVLTPSPTVPSANPSPTGTPSPVVLSPTLPLIEPAGVVVYETTITIDTYGYQDALVPTAPDDPVYPYPRIDFNAVTGPAPAMYTAVVLENAYVQVVVLPQLGGRIYRWTDKTTGRVLTYENPVIKPTYWGYRGWWLATGGIEWCLPTDEHGLNEYRPWAYSIGQRGVTVSDHEDRTGLDISVTIRLAATHNRIEILPTIRNNTGSAQELQFWINAVLSLANNHASESIRFVLPADKVRVHATDDAELPPAGQSMSWPRTEGGRDLSTYANWPGYLGVFADPLRGGFMGIYDVAADQGVARVFPYDVAPGGKFFGGKGLDPAIWTDDDSSYIELWGGWTETFWDYATLEPGGTISWTEYWYPLSGLAGGFDVANVHAALQLEPQGDGVRLGVAPTRNLIGGRALLFLDGQRVGEWEVTAGPGRSVVTLWSGAGAGEYGIRLLSQTGEPLIELGSVP